MNLLDRFKRIKTFVFDVDGVLTDGTLLIAGNGEYMRRMHIKDGYALQLAVKKGYGVMAISGSASASVTARLNYLGIKDVFMSETDKEATLDRLTKDRNLDWPELLYMGDDIPDYGVMMKAGLPCAPADAVSEIRQIARYISPWGGGSGCARDVIEKVLKLNHHWELHTGVASR